MILNIINKKCNNVNHNLSDDNIAYIVNKTEGFSGSDMSDLIHEACYGVLRSVGDLININKHDLPELNVKFFENAFNVVTKSVDTDTLKYYHDFNNKFGSRKG